VPPDLLVHVEKLFNVFGEIVTKRKRVVLTMKEKVKIVSRQKEGKWREELAEGYGVGTATLWDIIKVQNGF
jgi:predicted secreted protein